MMTGQPDKVFRPEGADAGGRDSDRILADLATAKVPSGLPPMIENLDAWVKLTLNCTEDACPGPQAPARTLSRVFEMVSRFNEVLTSRIIQQTVQDLEAEKGMPPPLPFCWITLGSDARGEQVLRTDQDNALIYADPAPGKGNETADYFCTLAKRVTTVLDSLGFSLCPGNVMASNPHWCRPLTQWLDALDQWVGSSDPMAVRNLTILLDFKAIFGDRRLAAMLQARVFDSFDRHPAASHFLVRDDQLFAPPKKTFNRIRTRKEKGCRACFNIKTQAIAHIVNGARLFAVNHHIRVPAALKRLEHLAADQVISQDVHEQYRAAFVFLTQLKIRHHLAGARSSSPALLPNHIDVAALNTSDKKALHLALDAVVRLQKKMAKTYNQAWMNFFN